MIILTKRICPNCANDIQDVGLVQKCLNELRDKRQRRFYDGRVDGRYGQKTQRAIQSFQEANKIREERASEISPNRRTIRELDRKLSQIGRNGPGQTVYSGLEKAIPFPDTKPNTSLGLFEIRSATIPSEAVPIFDEEFDAVIGYRHENLGVTKTFDLAGRVVDIQEIPLEKPLLDPIDLITLGGVAAISVRKIFQAGSRLPATGVTGPRLFQILTEEVTATLRTTFRGTTLRPIKFTAKTLFHMKNSDRFVPVHILKIAIKYGRRSPDPRGVKGAFVYKIPMTRKGRRYELEILLRERDNTVLHFVYER